MAEGLPVLRRAGGICRPVTWAALLRRGWPVLMVLACGLWVTRLDHLRGAHLARAVTAEAGRAVDQARGERDVARAEARHAERQIAAGNIHAERIAAREPLIVHSTNTMREYAKIDAGRLRCRAADRVRAIDALDADIAKTALAAGSGAGGVHAEAAAPAG